jgi:molecular chaperone Hsp33
MSAKALEARHLCGPTAACALGEALAAVALLSLDAVLSEAVSLKLEVAGPLGGLMVEATDEGCLRGYTNVKVLNDLDGRDAIDADAALGVRGTVCILRSTPTMVLNRATLSLRPVRIQAAAARYLNQSMQIPAAVELVALATAGGLLHVRGAMVEKMPDATAEAFIPVLERFLDGSVAAVLRESADLDRVAAAAGLAGLVRRHTRGLRFHCRCSPERAAAAISALPPEDLREMAGRGGPCDVTCHMCGETHAVAIEVVRAALSAKAT